MDEIEYTNASSHMMGCCFCLKKRKGTTPDGTIELYSDWSRELKVILGTYDGPIETKGSHELMVNFSGESFRLQPDGKLSFRKLEPLSLADTERLQWTDSRRMLEEAFDINKDVVSHDMLPDNQMGMNQRLSQRLATFGLQVDVQKGDGNCQFRSLAKQLFGDPEKHPVVREKATKYMNRHRRRFEPYLGPDFDRYLADMSKIGTWGDELTLRASSEAFNCMITVITCDRTNWYVRYIPEGALQGEVFLAFHNPCHYNALARKRNK